MYLQLINRCTLFALVSFAQRSAAWNIVKEACTGDAVYLNDACYTHDLTLKLSNDHMAQSCRTMNGLRGHLALPISSEVMQSWSVFTNAHPPSYNYVGVKRMSSVASKEDGWYFMRGTEKLHAQQLNATRNGDPPMLLPWATPPANPAQPDWTSVLACGQVHGADFDPLPGLWDNYCGQAAGYAICEFSVPHNVHTAVRMAVDPARTGLAFKPAAVTERLPAVFHRLHCLQKCVAAGAACRCVSYSVTSKDCLMSVFPCDRADMFESSNGGDVKVFKRVLH